MVDALKSYRESGLLSEPDANIPENASKIYGPGGAIAVGIITTAAVIAGPAEAHTHNKLTPNYKPPKLFED
jgi:hypothetical protein